tara:strand:- start:163 stop:927 length:765 start_codon:yes stop_codon:yes gene_type:complete
MEGNKEPKKRGRKKGSKNKKYLTNEDNLVTEEIIEKPIPKKRGRKPKENIIKNDNPVFNNDIHNNLIIRVKKDINKVSDINSYDSSDTFTDVNYDSNCCKVCWNCCHKCNNDVHGVPLKYINNIFYIYGYFCSLECSSRYIFDNFDNHFEIYSLINHYYNFLNDTNGVKINIAPKRLTLKMFGGTLDIEEYRKNFKTNTIFNVNIPPIYPINHCINTYENSINNINNSKQDLKLYRKSNLPNSENTISNTMNLG